MQMKCTSTIAIILMTSDIIYTFPLENDGSGARNVPLLTVTMAMRAFRTFREGGWLML